MSVSKPKSKKRKPRQRPPEFDLPQREEFVPKFESPLDSITGRLKGVVQGVDTQKEDEAWTRQYNALCPAHSDHSRSLSLSEKADGTAIVCCHFGCSAREILQAIGLKMLHLYPKDAKRKYTPKINPWRTYIISDGGGADE